MTTVVDTSVLIDVLRGNAAARSVLREASEAGALSASEVTRVEILAGMRSHEERMTRSLLSVIIWHPLDNAIAEIAGELGRRWVPGNRGIDTPALIIAATAQSLGGRLLTRNVTHFPMFSDLVTPY